MSFKCMHHNLIADQWLANYKRVFVLFFFQVIAILTCKNKSATFEKKYILSAFGWLLNMVVNCIDCLSNLFTCEWEVRVFLLY